jgi:uncharacterized membrane protein
MKFSDSKLLRQMVDQNVSESKILEFFMRQGYSERQVVDEIQDYERESRSRDVMKSIADMPSFSGEKAAIVHASTVARKDDVMKKVMTLFLVLGLVVIALIALYVILTRKA